MTTRRAESNLRQDMHTTLTLGLSILAVGSIPSAAYFLERRRRRKSEKTLATLKEMGDVDDQIFEMGMNSKIWPLSAEARAIILRRARLHEKYSALTGHRSLRDFSYVSGLMGPDVSTK